MHKKHPIAFTQQKYDWIFFLYVYVYATRQIYFWIDPKDRSTDFDITYNVQSIRKSINLLFRIFYFVKRNKMKDFDWFIFSYFIHYTLSKYYILYKILCFHPKQLIIVLIEQPSDHTGKKSEETMRRANILLFPFTLIRERQRLA